MKKCLIVATEVYAITNKKGIYCGEKQHMYKTKVDANETEECSEYIKIKKRICMTRFSSWLLFVE